MVTAPVDQFVHTCAWTRAATISERAARLHTAGARASMSPPPDGQQRLQRWRAQAPFHHTNILAQRFAADGLSMASFEELLAEPAARMDRLGEEPPGWVAHFCRAYAQPPALDVGLIQPMPTMSRTHYALLTAVEPLVSHGAARLRTQAQALADGRRTPPFNASTIHHVLMAHLSMPLVAMLHRTLILELNVARLQGQLHGETPEARFEHFITRLGQPDGALTLFQEYPVLARLLTEHVDRWVAAGVEFLQHLCADWDDIRTCFNIEQPGQLTELVMSGDPHCGGRTVNIATFSAGFRLVYKPRSLAVDQHFQGLLEWLNIRYAQEHPAAPLDPTDRLFRTLRVLHRGAYGWMEHVAMQPCPTLPAVQRFYYRQGKPCHDLLYISGDFRRLYPSALHLDSCSGRNLKALAQTRDRRGQLP